MRTQLRRRGQTLIEYAMLTALISIIAIAVKTAIALKWG